MSKVLLIVGGGIAAYKSLELVRLLKKAGHEVTPVLTKGGEQIAFPFIYKEMPAFRKVRRTVSRVQRKKTAPGHVCVITRIFTQIR